jgi:hypothetical protein
MIAELEQFRSDLKRLLQGEEFTPPTQERS